MGHDSDNAETAPRKHFDSVHGEFLLGSDQFRKVYNPETFAHVCLIHITVMLSIFYSFPDLVKVYYFTVLGLTLYHTVYTKNLRGLVDERSINTPIDLTLGPLSV